MCHLIPFEAKPEQLIFMCLSLNFIGGCVPWCTCSAFCLYHCLFDPETHCLVNAFR